MPVQGEFFQNPGGGGGFYGHQITNSCRFSSDSNTVLRFGGASGVLGTPTNVDKGTLSCWLKRTVIGNVWQNIYHSHTGSSGRNIAFDYNNTDDTIGMDDFGNSTSVFRDVTGWYNLIFAFDTTQGSNNDRCKVYVNGSYLNQFNSSVSQNTDVKFFVGGNRFYVGYNEGGASYALDGYMADVIYVDGQQLEPTAVGESKNGVWIPVDYSGSYGNNGFRLEFKQSGTGADANGLGADTSGNNHHFSLINMGADHQVLDSPTFGS